MPLLSMPLPDAEAQCLELAELIRPRLTSQTALVGVYTGGVWVAERLRDALGLETIGSLDISFYRDDFAEKGLHPQLKPTTINFEVEGRHLILVDDVLFTGRTTRAAMNELFDYGRPARVELAVLADRGGRELPVAAQYCVWHPDLAGREGLVLTRGADQRLAWSVENA